MGFFEMAPFFTMNGLDANELPPPLAFLGLFSYGLTSCALLTPVLEYTSGPFPY
jgi:hypothetical protein